VTTVILKDGPDGNVYRVSANLRGTEPAEVVSN
jgi:hypothetical protein